MDLFRVETGSALASSCVDESYPMFHGQSVKNEKSKAFLVHDSMACITNFSLTLGDKAVANAGFAEDPVVKRNKTTYTHVVDDKSPGRTSPGSSGYLFLSPSELEDPVLSPVNSTIKGNVAARSSEKETDCLLETEACNLKVSNGLTDKNFKLGRSVEKAQPPEQDIVNSPVSISDQHIHLSSTSYASDAVKPDQPDQPLSSSSPSSSTSSRLSKMSDSSYLLDRLDEGTKKTLKELANEWNASQENTKVKASSSEKAVTSKTAMTSRDVKGSCDDESVLDLVDNSEEFFTEELSVGDMQECVDPALVEIQPSHKPTELPTQSKTNPDEDLIRHSEYHRPYETKIDAAKKSSDARLSSPPPAATVTGESSARKMTLVELARLRSASTDEKDESKSVRSSSLVSDKVTVEITPTNDETADNDSLVRHSEFYQGSKSPNVTRRRSADSQLSLGEPVAERRPTLVDMLQKNTDTDDDNNNDNRIGNNISVQKDVSASRESIYSMDGDYSNNNISGEILLSYHYLNGDFKIKVFEARGIAATDKNKSTSDPYVKVYLLPDQSRTGKRKTKTKYGTLDPEFNEEILYKIGTRELLTRTIWLTMWNYDRFGRNDFLGEVRIPLKDFKGSKEHPKWHTLCEMIPDSTSDSCGELTVALMYSPTEKKRKKETNAGKLYVKIVEAKNLPGKDSDHLSDPFCKSYLLPDPGKKTKKKTPVMKRNLNPYWDYKFSYDNLSLEELHSCVLELTVWDHDLGTSNDFLGGVRIGLGTSDAEWDDCEGEEVSLWQFLLSKPNTWTQSILPLRNQMGSRKGLKT